VREKAISADALVPAAEPPFTAWARSPKGFGGWKFVGSAWSPEGAKALGRMLAPGEHIAVVRAGTQPPEFLNEDHRE
jgi:hypothetical protein